MSHTNFTEVTWMVFVEVDSVVMLTTSKTTTTTVTTFSVFTDTTLAMGDLTAHLSRLLITSSHFCRFVSLKIFKISLLEPLDI